MTRMLFISKFSVIPAITVCDTCPWDDFFDFSRMKQPKKGWGDFDIVINRLRMNYTRRFKANYLALTLCMLLLAGILFDPQMLIAYLISLVIWNGVCYLSESDNSSEIFYHRDKIIAKEDRVRFFINISLSFIGIE